MNDFTEARHHARDLRQQAERAALRHRVNDVATWERRAARRGAGQERR